MPVTLSRRLLGILLATLLVSLVPAHADSGDLQRAIRLFKETKYQDALPLLDLILRDNPKNVEALILRSRTLEELEFNDRALADAEAAIKLDPKHPLGYHARGMVYYEEKRYPAARADCAESLRLEARNAPALHLRGLLHDVNGHKDKALADYNAATEIDPEYALAYFSRASQYGKEKRYDEALAEYGRLLQVTPSSADAYYLRGHLILGIGRFEAAFDDLDQAIKHNPKHIQAYLARAQVYRLRRNWDKSQADLSEVLRLDPKHMKALLQRGESYYWLGDLDKALADSEAALKVDETSSRPHALLGTIYLKRQEVEKAFAELNRAIELDGRFPFALARRAEIYRLKGDQKRAADDVDRALEINPAEPTAKRLRDSMDQETVQAQLKQLEQGKSQAVWPLLKLHQVGRGLPRDPEAAAKQLDGLLAFLPRFVEDHKKDMNAVCELCEQLTRCYQIIDPKKDRQTGHVKVAKALDKIAPQSSLYFTVQGSFLSTYAWDARGGGWADTVTEPNAKLFSERLAEAETAFEKAWKLDPKNALAPTKMITVAMGLGQPRARMEIWFERAMQAEPDNYAACHYKLFYLEPKWLGSEKEMLDFGRQCLKAGNWRMRIPFILIRAHENLSRYPRGDRKDYATQTDRDYFKNGAAWDDIRDVHEGYLKHFPESHGDRSYYAVLACWSGKWAEAHRQFDVLGDKAVVSVFGSKEEYLRLRREAAEKRGVERP